MYEAARKRQNIIVLVMVLLLAALLFGGYRLIDAYANGSPVGVAGIFIALTGVTYVGIRGVTRHTEAIMVHSMVAAGKIALARVDQVRPLRDVRDFCLRKHHLYTFVLTVFTVDGLELVKEVVEDIVEGVDCPAPGSFFYVTFDEGGERMGIVPTINIYVSPQLKDKIRALEKHCKPRYVEVVRSNGLIFRPFRRRGEDGASTKA